MVKCRTGGNTKLAQMVKNLEVYGAESGIGALNRRVKHQDKFKVGSLEVTALSTPCHTSGHVCYYVAGDQGTHCCLSVEAVKPGSYHQCYVLCSVILVYKLFSF